MAAAVLTSSILASRWLSGPVVAVQASCGRIQTSCSRSHMSYSQKHFQSSVLTITKSSRMIVRAAPSTSFEKRRPGAITVTADLRREPAPAVIEKDEAKETVLEMQQWIEDIREMFRCMDDGEITTSPYDTAWVAMVPSLDGSVGPQFPKSLQWIIDNQMSDGSWGDRGYFSYFDRVCNTLACVVALTTWQMGPGAVERGVNFIQKNLQAMETEEDAHMMIGFEIVFPALILTAEKLELDIPYDAPVIHRISAERQKKLSKIPRDVLHKVPTTLLHSLEAFHEEVDWDQLLKLQNEDGSFLSSPAATAACLLHRRDERALGYLSRLLDRFNNAVPNVYPVDLFERAWVVDRLQRLGIDRYFVNEIKDSLDYVFKYFTSSGIGWARGSPVQDLDDTSMAFRLLRQHGYDVSENVFRQFAQDDNDFVCFRGQSCQAVSGTFNFYRAAQTRFPGEDLLEIAERFARGMLTEKLERNECVDKWVITKDLAGEVEYALRTPWYCSLPRLEVSAYIDDYGADDVWIGKSLYRMPFVSNPTFLALAKADYNLAQTLHQLDLHKITRWNEECGFGKLPFARQKHIEAVFSAVSIFPEPELAPARLAWARNCVLTTVVDDYFDVGGTLPEMRRFVESAREWNPSLMEGTSEAAQMIFNGLYSTINAIAKEGQVAQGRDIGPHLRSIWLRWLESILTEAEWTEADFWPSFDEYLETASPSVALEPILLCTLFFLGEPLSDEIVNDPKKLRLMDLVNRIGRLLNDIQGWKRESSESKVNAVSIMMRKNSAWTSEDEAISRIRAMVEESMLKLVWEVHQPSHLPKAVRQAHFNTARVMQLFYQKTDAFTDFITMKQTIKKVLFQPMS